MPTIHKKSINSVVPIGLLVSVGIIVDYCWLVINDFLYCFTQSSKLYFLLGENEENDQPNETAFTSSISRFSANSLAAFFSFRFSKNNVNASPKAVTATKTPVDLSIETFKFLVLSFVFKTFTSSERVLFFSVDEYNSPNKNAMNIINTHATNMMDVTSLLVNVVVIVGCCWLLLVI